MTENWAIWWRHADMMLTSEIFLTYPSTYSQRLSLKPVVNHHHIFYISLTTASPIWYLKFLKNVSLDDVMLTWCWHQKFFIHSLVHSPIDYLHNVWSNIFLCIMVFELQLPPIEFQSVIFYIYPIYILYPPIYILQEFGLQNRVFGVAITAKR